MPVALGLGINTAAFTTFNAYVLRPLAVRDPASLYEVSWNKADGSTFGLSWRGRAMNERAHQPGELADTPAPPPVPAPGGTLRSRSVPRRAGKG
jgi:hypothetical protein